MSNSDYIDLRGDGRIVLSLRGGMKHPKYQVRIKIPGSTGYKRVSTKTSDLREAERFSLDLYEELYFHVKSGGSLKTKTYKQVFDEWKSAINRTSSPDQKNKWDGTISRVETYSVEFFGPINIEKIGRKEFAEYWEWRKSNYKRTLPSNETLNRERTAILALLRFCLERSYITSLPTIPKTETKGISRRPTFTKEEWRKITRNMREWVKEGKSVGKWRDRFVLQQYVLILANTGIRIGEARHLRWSDLRTVQTMDGTRLIGDVRGKTGRREVAFQKGSEDYIKRLYDLRSDELGHKPDNDEIIFLSRKTGRPYTTLKTAFNSMLKYCGINPDRNGVRRTIYSIRHFYATQRLSEDTSPFLLSQQMGTSVEMLEKFYGHVITSEVADRITKSSSRSEPQNKTGGYPFEV